jgi:hypothetical protein
MPKVTPLRPGVNEYEFEVKGRIIIAAHCHADAVMELEDILSEVFLDHTHEQV